MIKQILSLLKIDDFYNESELIDIAKGKYKLDNSLIGMYKQKKRTYLTKVKNGRN